MRTIDRRRNHEMVTGSNDRRIESKSPSLPSLHPVLPPFALSLFRPFAIEETLHRLSGTLLAIAVASVAAIALLCGLSACADSLTHEVYGNVTYPDGSPAAGVRLVWQRLNECKENEVTTDSGGGYRISFQGQSGGNYVGIKAAKGDYVLRAPVTIPEGSREPVRKDLVMEFACLVLGEVTDASTGEPIEDAEVNICGSYGAETRTGPNGLFRVRVLRRGGLQLQVSKGGYVTHRMEFSAQDTNAAAWRVQLKPGGVVRGQVVDQDGKPVAGIGVRVSEDSCYTRCVRTGEDGRYEIRDVDPGRTASLSVEDPRISISPTKHVEFPRGSTETVADLVVDLAGKTLRTVSGQITDESGAPVAGAEVHFGRSTCQWNKKSATTDAQGNYALSDLTPDKDMILVQAGGYAPSFAPVDDTGDQRIDVKLAKAHSAELRVLDPGGKPMAGVSVTVNARTPVLGRLYQNGVSDSDVYRWLYTTATDENGRVVLKDLPAEGVLLDTWIAGHAAPNNTAIRVDATDNVIRMQGMPQVAGTVVDAATGAPIRAFTVKWSTPGGYSLGGDENEAFSRPDGKFIVQVGDSRFIEAREFLVRVLADGYVGESKIVSATDAPKADYSNVFKLEKARAAKGRVVDASGKGIPDVHVTVVEHHGYWRFTSPPRVSPTAYQQKLTTGPDGSFTINPLREKIGTIIVEKQGYPKLVEQDTDLTKPLKLVLQMPSELTVRAASMAGEGARVDLTFDKNRCYSVVASKDIPADGKVHFEGLESGHYLLSVRGKQQSEMRDFTLEPGKPHVVDLDGKRLVTLSGTVTRGGVPVPDVNVSIERGTNRYSSSSRTDAQGRYTISVEAPGPATLVHYQMNGSQITGRDSRPVDLKNGQNTIDVKLPSGTISGRLVDAKTGQPLDGQSVAAWAKWQPPARRVYSEPSLNGGYGRVVSATTTGKDGMFTLSGLPDGPVVLTVVGQLQRTRWIGSPLTVSEKKPVRGVEIRLPEPGRLGVSVVDSRSGKPVDAASISLYTRDGAPVITDNRYRETTSVPAGEYVMWVEPTDGKHMPAYAEVDVLPGKTALATVKLNPAAQRIVFRAARGGKLEKLRWPDKDPRPSQGPVNVLTQSEDMFRSRPWIGFALSDAATGKPVLAGPSGPKWGDYLTGFDGKREAVLPIKPGAYTLDAVLRNTEDYKVDSNANLWRKQCRVTVKPGKDTVIAVQ